MISNYGVEITGLQKNLKFQEIDRFDTYITDKPALILTATYLKSVSDRVKNKLWCIPMFDMDTNRDGNQILVILNLLYLSDISGEKYQNIY
jgi:hypothetical protein